MQDKVLRYGYLIVVAGVLWVTQNGLLEAVSESPFWGFLGLWFIADFMGRVTRE